MRFQSYLKKVEEDPVAMFVDDDGQEMDTAHSFAFGVLLDKVYVAGFFGGTLKDLKITENGRPLIDAIKEIEKEIEPLIGPYAPEDKNTLDRYLHALLLKPLLHSANRFEPYHDFIAQVARSMLFCRKLIDGLKRQSDLTKEEYSSLVKSILKETQQIMNKNIPLVERNGLKPAGRIFAQVKGISFYGPKPSKTEVVKILKYAGIEDLAGFTIEYEEEDSKWVQVTMDEFNVKTDAKSSNKTEKDVADELKAKQRKPIKLKPGEFRAQKHYERGNRGG